MALFWSIQGVSKIGSINCLFLFISTCIIVASIFHKPKSQARFMRYLKIIKTF